VAPGLAHALGRCAIARVVAAVGYALSFSPWIAYGVVSASLTWRAGVYAALIVQLALAAWLLRRRELDALSVGTLAFFAAMSAVALASPQAAIHRWLAVLSAGALALIALASLAVRQPFTLAIARRSTPPELWDHPEFMRLNRYITAVWSVAFVGAAGGCSLAIGLLRDDTGAIIAANAVALLGAGYVTRRTVKRAEARAGAAGLM
jgi:hypothetical protein